MQWFYKVGVNSSGISQTGLLTAEDEERALDVAREISLEFAESYGFCQDLEYFGDYDQVGIPEEDEDGEAYYDSEGCIDYEVELYVPEKHDGCY